LIAEDDLGIAMALEDDLRSAGYAVAVVGDGERAIASALAAAFDVILLDIMLPKKDGLAVCQALRSAGVRTPVILLTARSQEADKVRGLESGADDYLTKPYSPLELRARIKALLRRASDGTPETFRFGDCELDFSRRELRRRGVVVPLTPLEFRLLDTFVRHRGRALGRQRLIDDAWGPATFVTDRVVDNQVTNLRKKIEPTASAPVFLVSIRGFGYRFDGPP
jgi:DNA-binding response OmpR family regulator